MRGANYEEMVFFFLEWHCFGLFEERLRESLTHVFDTRCSSEECGTVASLCNVVAEASRKRASRGLA